MKRFILSSLAYLLFSSFPLCAQTYLTSGEYWLDGDYSQRKTVAVVDGEMSFTLDATPLREGLHTLSYHVQDNSGNYSSVGTWMFMHNLFTDTLFTVSNGEYWLDGDYSQRKTVAVVDGEMSFALDATPLREGLHTLSYHVKDSHGNYSPVDTWMFVRNAMKSQTVENGAELVEYWFDDEIAQVQSVSATSNDISFVLNASALSDGTHTLNYRVRDKLGQYTSLSTWEFLVVPRPDSLVLTEDLILASGERFTKTTSMSIRPGVKFIVYGTEDLAVNNMNLENNLAEDAYTQILSNPEWEAVTVSGEVSERIYTRDSTWYFLSLPFDCDLSRLKNESKSAYVIRYYDGASRAANNVANGNWKNYGKRDIIPMGTGFIFMTQQNSWTRFYAVDNENKAHVFQSTSGETTLGLERHEATSAKNSGWNLVGNPYANYYSIQSMDFSKAVTVWNGASYDAVFPSDDDLALKPGQAFFVQCPSGVESITLPGSGRQLTAEVIGGAKARSASARGTRRLINLSLTDSQFTDKTRVVLNEEASMGYELEHDAGKFMSMRTEVPQLYSLGTDGTKYAINERPMDDGTVRLGLYIPQDGDYTLTITRNDAEEVLLTDSETGQTVDLTEGSYRFYAKKGTYNNRLMLTFGTVTGMDDVRWTTDDVPGEEAYYDLSGRRIGKPTRAGVYLLKQGKAVQKLLVK